ncbi:aminotransferase class IV [Urechidicola croceus]|uniref:branched-chain-amino-acid transaminase n=1 Tax=Urechidicola croceus TaxID=1850246 RepID=A0A1D8P4M8_9FLAO|nr:aminotransferase class IV [Urechidicola croceus]AOW19549.1 aminotransferase class IV [Urechidicola croceus]
MINFNGELVSANKSILSKDNRGLKYGDGVFETIKMHNSKLIFFEEHYFRLMASMRMLRMDIPMNFTLEYVESQIQRVAKANKLVEFARVRLTVFRKDGGLYTPMTNEIDFVIEVTELNIDIKNQFTVELYKDFYIYSGLLSTIKTTNRILNVVASIFSKENDFDSCLLINEKKQLVEAIYGNIFLVFGTTVVTPSITSGCVKGIVRAKLINILKKKLSFSVEEREVSPFELQKADELFITNSIIDIQPVTNYRKKVYKKEITTQIAELLRNSY